MEKKEENGEEGVIYTPPTQGQNGNLITPFLICILFLFLLKYNKIQNKNISLSESRELLKITFLTRRSRN